MRRTIALAFALAALSACNKKEEPHRGFTFAAGSATSKPERACTPGSDASCNDEPLDRTVHGTCSQDGTCSCHPGFSVNPRTGRCRM